MTVLDERPVEAPTEATETPEAPRSVLRTMSRRGDTPIHWTRGVAVEETAARAAFDAMKSKGYAAYRVEPGSGGERGEILHRFDPAAEEIVMVPPIAGG